MSRIAEALKGYEEMKSKMEAAKRDAMKPARQALLLDFKDAFEKYPEIVSAQWTQYTPYFNDGEPCEFRVNEILLTNKKGKEHYVWGEGYSEFPRPDGVDEDVMLDLFGDHVSIVLTRGADDFEVNEYDHD